MMKWILDNYVKDGEIVADVMCGIGTTLIEGMLMFPNSVFIGVEYEMKFCKVAQANIRKVKRYRDQIPMGKSFVIHGDARALPFRSVDKCVFSPPFYQPKGGRSGILEKGYQHTPDDKPDYVINRSYISENIGGPTNLGNLKKYGEIEKIITSPPYGDTFSPREGGEIKSEWNKHRDKRSKRNFSYNPNNDNIGNLPRGKIDKVITSPPYSEVKKGGEIDGLKEAIRKEEHTKNCREGAWQTPGRVRAFQSMNSGYSNNPQNLGNLPHGAISKVITSPPYEGSISGKDTQARKREFEYCKKIGIKGGTAGNIITAPSQYSSNPNNIGNLREQTYLNQMFLVYQECFRVLKSNGLLILITKNFIRNKKIIRLDEDTTKLCQLCGFTLENRHYREIEHPSFWRMLLKKRFPDMPEIRHEDILVFRKEEKKND